MSDEQEKSFWDWARQIGKDGNPQGLVMSHGIQKDAFNAGYQSRQAEIDRLAAEVEALRKDAERYRWLRSGEANSTTIYKDYGHTKDALFGAEADEEIDKALERK